MGLAGCAAPTPEAVNAPASEGPSEGTMRWTVGPARVDCVGVGPMFCMVYRDAPGGPWKRFYGEIEGFRFVPGDEVDILVRAVPVPRPPADASSRRIVLVREESRRTLAGVALPPVLAGTAWVLESVVGTPAALGLRGAPMLAFGEGAISGQTGVNRFNARADAGEGWIRIGPVAMTRMAGPPEMMKQEREFLDRLQRCGAWRVDGDRLHLRDAQGQTLLRFRRDGAR